jgi:HK97 family phage major capsid protein
MSMRYQGSGEVKTLLVSADVAGQIQPMPMFGGSPLELLQRRPVVADLIPQGATNSPSLRYVEETVNTNGADFVAEGGTKPESAMAFADRTATVRKIATVLPVTDEMFADAPAMRSYVEARLRLFMALREETSLVSGTGTGLEYYGLLTVPGSQGINTATYGGNVLDTLYQAMVAIQVNSFLEPSGVIMNPLDWADIITLKTADGVYIWGNPSAAPGPERVWGLPVVATPVMTQNTAVVAAFNSSMQIFRREGVSFAVSDQHNDFFVTNKLMLRVEERLAFVIYRPQGICVVTGV